MRKWKKNKKIHLFSKVMNIRRTQNNNREEKVDILGRKKTEDTINKTDKIMKNNNNQTNEENNAIGKEYMQDRVRKKHEKKRNFAVIS